MIIIVFPSMSQKQFLKSMEVSYMISNLLNGPVLSFMPHSAIEKLKENLKNQVIQHQVLKLLGNRLKREEETQVRLKCWTLMHYLISQKISCSSGDSIEKVIQQCQKRISHKLEDKSIVQGDEYFMRQVELPYLVFLKKLTVWNMFRMSALETDLIDLGFSELNKIREILQLKKIFHNYSCYYPSHEYSLNFFEACLHNIKTLWTSVCLKIKTITLDSIQYQQIEEKEYLLIKEAEKVQELLLEFVYGEKMCLKLPKDLRIRQVNLVKPEVDKLQSKRKRKESISATMEVIEEKKVRKASMGTMDSERSFQKVFQVPVSAKRSENDQKLNTDVQIEILETIHQLQNLIEC